MVQSRSKAATEETVADTAATDVVKSDFLSEESLRNIGSIADAIAVAEAAYGPAVSAEEELGDGFTLVKDLTKFMDVPVVILEWTFRPGDFGKTYVSFRFVAQMSTGIFKGVYNDGGTGIRKQLTMYTDRTGRMGALTVRGGFRVSEYDTIKSGEPWKEGVHAPSEKAGKGKTWYLNV